MNESLVQAGFKPPNETQPVIGSVFGLHQLIEKLGGLENVINRFNDFGNDFNGQKFGHKRSPIAPPKIVEILTKIVEEEPLEDRSFASFFNINLQQEAAILDMALLIADDTDLEELIRKQKASVKIEIDEMYKTRQKPSLSFPQGSGLLKNRWRPAGTVRSQSTNLRESVQIWLTERGRQRNNPQKLDSLVQKSKNNSLFTRRYAYIAYALVAPVFILGTSRCSPQPSDTSETRPRATEVINVPDYSGESATGGEVESQNKVVITEEIVLDYFDNFSSYSYTNRDWSLVSSIDLARGEDDSLTIAHPVIDGVVKTGLDIVKGSATYQAKEDGEGVITQKRNLLAVEGKDGKIYTYILLFDKDQSTIGSDRAVLRYRLGDFAEDGETLIEIKGGWYTEELKAGEDGKAQLVEASITNRDIDLVADIVEESGVGEPTLEPTPPASFADGSFDDIVQSITGAEEVKAAPPPTEEIQPTPPPTVQPTQPPPTPTETQPPTPTPKSTEVWEGNPSQTEIENLANQLPCSSTDECIREEFFSHTEGHTWGVRGISTGKLKDVDIIDYETGLKVGSATFAVYITLDKNGAEKLFYVPVQGATIDRPDYNLFANVLGYDATEMGEPDVNYNPIYELMPKDFLARVYRKGVVFSYLFSIDDYDINYDFLKFYEVLLKDPAYQARLQAFWQESGVDADNNDPLMIFPRGGGIISK